MQLSVMITNCSKIKRLQKHLVTNCSTGAR